MSDTIDLDLVELRCKLRGWKCERTKHPVCVRQTGIDWSDDDVWVVKCRKRALLFAKPDGVGVGLCELEEADLALLTAPRWTLERLISEPPEGWRAAPMSDSEVEHAVSEGIIVLDWGGEDDDPEIRAAFGFVAGVPIATIDPAKAGRPARLAERLKAAAELALILAEVEP